MCKDDSKKCIPYEKVCDKSPDCADSSDEPLHCGRNECLRTEDNGCAHTCVDTKESYTCECNPGYKLMDDGKACAGIVTITILTTYVFLLTRSVVSSESIYRKLF